MLRLEDVWISKRARWWAILTAPFVGCVQVGTPGHLDPPNLAGDLLPRPLTLSAPDLLQLELRDQELAVFCEFAAALARLFLSKTPKGPTALHSWGNQAQACQCVCRAAGFSHATLSSRVGFLPCCLAPLLRITLMCHECDTHTRLRWPIWRVFHICLYLQVA